MPNTDTKINYYLRQQKSIQRRMFCHLFSNINRIFNLHEYQYIGMGAKYFVDYLLFHREFDFQKMISIEADCNTEKYEFNKPLNCIEMVHGFSGEVLPKLDWTTSIRSIVWLDYDSCLDKSMMEDIETVLSKLISGSMFFVSFNSKWVKGYKRREDQFKENLQEYYPKHLSPDDFETTNKHKTQCIPINNTINRAISIKSDMTYTQLIDFIYQDNVEMTTIGGIVLNETDKEIFDKLDFSHLNFINSTQGAEAFSLIVPPLTYKEAIKIFEHLPCDNYSTINVPGLSSEQINQIANIYRYYPFYLETSVFT